MNTDDERVRPGSGAFHSLERHHVRMLHHRRAHPPPIVNPRGRALGQGDHRIGSGNQNVQLPKMIGVVGDVGIVQIMNGQNQGLTVST